MTPTFAEESGALIGYTWVTLRSLAAGTRHGLHSSDEPPRSSWMLRATSG